MINRVIIEGRLVADAELKTTPSGVFVTSFCIANNVGYGDKQATYWIDVVAWRKTAEFVTKHFRKGERICIEGKLTTREYMDKEGKSRKKVEIVADEVYFMESKRGSTENSEPVNPYTSERKFEEITDDEELPF